MSKNTPSPHAEGKISSEDKRVKENIVDEEAATIKAKAEVKNQEDANKRKFMKIDIAFWTIVLGFGLLLVWGFLIFIITWSNVDCCRPESTNEINFLSPIISGVINIITLAFGFIAGSTLD